MSPTSLKVNVMKGLRKGALIAAAIGMVILPGANAGDQKARSTELFNGFCNRCHGLQGEGNVGLEAPLIAGMASWYVEKQLQNFRTDVRGTHPKDMPGMRMRPMARALYPESDVKAIADYVAAMPIRGAQMAIKGADTEKGKAAYALCMGCHGPDAKGVQAIGGPGLAGQSDWYLLTQLKNFKAGIRPGPLMQPMVAAMDEDTMRNLAAYLGSLPGH